MYLLFCGRFQPFHNGHLSLLRRTARHSGQIVVGVLITMKSSAPTATSPANDFTALGDQRCEEDLNPFTVVDRVRMISASVGAEPWSAGAVVVAVPRPDLYWQLIEAMFPGLRTWILPTNDDPINDAKERFYSAKGDRVLRIVVDSDVSGTGIREALLRDPSTASGLVPEPVAAFLRAHRLDAGV